jgi:hypothetical protein
MEIRGDIPNDKGDKLVIGANDIGNLLSPVLLSPAIN